MKSMSVVHFPNNPQNVLFDNWTQLNTNLIFEHITTTGSISAVQADAHTEQAQLSTTDHRQTKQDSDFHANFDDTNTFQVNYFYVANTTELTIFEKDKYLPRYRIIPNRTR